MKRYFCTAAAGLLLALGSTGTASATGLPVVGGTQEATQSVSFGDQTVGEQRNDADITQEQGKWQEVRQLPVEVRRVPPRWRLDLERPGQRQHRHGGRRPVELGRPVPARVPVPAPGRRVQGGGVPLARRECAGRARARPALLLRGRAMASSTPTTARRRPKLTQREREVLALIACGYSTSEIARALWITEETVRTHVKRSLTRLRARTRAHAVAIAFREGLWRREDQDGEGGDDV